MSCNRAVRSERSFMPFVLPFRGGPTPLCPWDAQRDDASEQTEEAAEITSSYDNYHNTFLMVSANMPTAVKTAVMSARMSSVAAAKTSMVRRRMMRLAVGVLALTPNCVLDRTALSRSTAGAFSGGGSFPVDKESR